MTIHRHPAFKSNSDPFLSQEPPFMPEELLQTFEKIKRVRFHETLAAKNTPLSGAHKLDSRAAIQLALASSNQPEQITLFSYASKSELEKIMLGCPDPKMGDISSHIIEGRWSSFLEEYRNYPAIHHVILSAYARDQLKKIDDVATAFIFLAGASVEKGYRIIDLRHSCAASSQVPSNQRFKIEVEASTLHPHVNILLDDLSQQLKKFGVDCLEKITSEDHLQTFYRFSSFSLIQSAINERVRVKGGCAVKLTPILHLTPERFDMCQRIRKGLSDFALFTPKDHEGDIHGAPAHSILPYAHDVFHAICRSFIELCHYELALQRAEKVIHLLKQLPPYTKPLISKGFITPVPSKGATLQDLALNILDETAGNTLDGPSEPDELDVFLDFDSYLSCMKENLKEELIDPEPLDTTVDISRVLTLSDDEADDILNKALQLAKEWLGKV